MENLEARARFWADFICNRCDFPAPERLREHFANALFLEFCECGCNSFKVEVNGSESISRRRSYGPVFEANFRLSEPEKTLEIILFSGDSGNVEYVEIDCCANSFPVPQEIHVQEPPFHVYASPDLVL